MNLIFAYAKEKALQRAKNYYGKNFGSFEIWEQSSKQVTIRANNLTGDDYGFFTEQL